MSYVGGNVEEEENLECNGIAREGSYQNKTLSRISLLVRSISSMKVSLLAPTRKRLGRLEEWYYYPHVIVAVSATIAVIRVNDAFSALWVRRERGRIGDGSHGAPISPAVRRTASQVGGDFFFFSFFFSFLLSFF